MSVTSNGATMTKDAMNHSANILRQHMQFFMFDDSLSIKAVNDDEINEALQLKNILSKRQINKRRRLIKYNKK